MGFCELKDKASILNYCQRDKFLHIYSIGDLDDFFWPYTKWYGWTENEIEALVLLYRSGSQSTLLALSDENSYLEKVLGGMMAVLPDNFYAHLSPGLEAFFGAEYDLQGNGRHLKMALSEPGRLMDIDISGAVRLGRKNLEQIKSLYEVAYPGNWFDERMLDTEQYFGIFVSGKLASIAGIHVYSPEYGVAALGNITSSPQFRRQGLGTIVTAACCRSILKSVGNIGLNIKADNYTALELYKKLGFKPHAPYYEFNLQRKAG